MIAPIMDVQPHDRRLSSTAVFHCRLPLPVFHCGLRHDRRGL